MTMVKVGFKPVDISRKIEKMLKDEVGKSKVKTIPNRTKGLNVIITLERRKFPSCEKELESKIREIGKKHGVSIENITIKYSDGAGIGI